MSITCMYERAREPDRTAIVALVSSVAFVGGAERSLLSLASSLKHAGQFTPLFVSYTRGEIENRCSALGITCHPLGLDWLWFRQRWARWLVLPAAIIMEILKLKRLLQSRHIALLHANGTRACLSALLAAHAAGVPCIWHVRDYPRRKHVHRFILKRVSAVIVASDYVETAVRNFAKGLLVPVRVIANPVTERPTDPQSVQLFRKSLGLKASDILVTMPGQLVPWKRHDLFLQAADYVCRKVHNVFFAVVGEDLWGCHSRYVRNLRDCAASNRISGRVRFMGHREDIGTVLAGSDIVALPSQREPFGRVVIEAWWANTAVIVSDNGGPAQLVQDGVTGIHFKDGDFKDLAAAILRLAGDPSLRESLAAAGKARASEYLPARHYEAVLQLYSELLTASQTPGA